MKLVKKGTKKFIRICEEDIYLGECNACGAKFEIQRGEMGREECGGYHTIICPYCGKYHSNYNFTFIRRETMPLSEVVEYDCLRSPTREVSVDEWLYINARKEETE